MPKRTPKSDDQFLAMWQAIAERPSLTKPEAAVVAQERLAHKYPKMTVGAISQGSQRKTRDLRRAGISPDGWAREQLRHQGLGLGRLGALPPLGSGSISVGTGSDIQVADRSETDAVIRQGVQTKVTSLRAQIDGVFAPSQAKKAEADALMAEAGTLATDARVQVAPLEAELDHYEQVLRLL